MKIFLAPMADITNRAFRETCYEAGADSCFSEMISAKAVTFNNRRTLELADMGPEEHATVIQLFGAEPKSFYDAVKILLEKLPSHFRGFDINMGCPVKKVIKTGAGSMLMTDPGKSRDIIRAVRSACDKQLSVKIRRGFSTDSWKEISRIAVEEGADMLIIHPRLKTEMFGGVSDISISLSLAQMLPVPVVHSGDITRIDDLAMIRDSSLAGIMVGRGALGRPWIFRELKQGYATEEEYHLFLMELHLKKLLLYCNGNHLITELKKTAAWYSRGYREGAKFRQDIFQSPGTVDEVALVIKNFFGVSIL